MKEIQIRYKKLDEKAKLPYKKYDIDAGFDLTAIWKKDTDKYTEYGTGLAFEIPEGYVGLLFPRSSVTNMDLMLKNCVGVVDASYRGEIMFRYSKYFHDLYKDDQMVDLFMGRERKPDYYEIGDRCGQIVFLELPMVKLQLSDELSETERGPAGYGSSGNK